MLNRPMSLPMSTAIPPFSPPPMPRSTISHSTVEMATTIGLPGIENGIVHPMVVIQAVVGPGSGGFVVVVAGDGGIEREMDFMMVFPNVQNGGGA